MIQQYLSLIVSIIINLVIIDFIFVQVEFNEKIKNYDIKIFIANLIELIIMLIVSSGLCYYFLKETTDSVVLIYMISILSLVILLWWLIAKTKLLADYLGIPEYNFDIGLNDNNDNVSDKTNNVSTLRVKNSSFSKYHGMDNNRDFSFENSYPDYDKIEPSLNNVDNSENNHTGNVLKDYSMYNGYDPDNICYRCGCITNEKGYTFCGKKIPGMGTIGCSKNWKCRNCKKCEDSSNTPPVEEKTDIYTCKTCKCLNTVAGKVCGKVSTIDGNIKKCNSDCKECDECYGIRDSGNNNYINSNNRRNNNNIVVQPESNLSKIVVNNIKNSDLNNIFN